MNKTVLNLILTCLAIVVFYAQPAMSQPNCLESDLLTLVFDNGDINIDAPDFTPLNGKLLLLNPSVDCINGFQMLLQIPPGFVLLESSFPVGCTNVATAPGEYLVSFHTPVYPDSNIVELCSISFLITESEPIDIFFNPSESSLIPNTMSYLGCPPDEIMPMEPISRDFALPVARINGDMDLAYCFPVNDEWFTVRISAFDDTNNVIGISSITTDGYDPSHDQLDPVPTPTIFFPHPEWDHPDGDNFQHDIKSMYNPLSDLKQWTFVVDAEIGQSGSTMVNLSFEPSFSPGDGISIALHDNTTDRYYTLTPPYQYSYELFAADYRFFNLIVGAQPPPPEIMQLIVDVSLGQHHDNGNMAATQEGASDFYDPELDLAEPGPPPANYLVGSFSQPDWPQGTRYQTDVRAPFNPLLEAKTWVFPVETDGTGTVVMDFEPSFNSLETIGLIMKDLVTGQLFNLFPNLVYSFQADGENNRNFEISMGAFQIPVPPLTPESRVLDEGWSIVGFPLTSPIGQNTLDQVILNQAPGLASAYLFQGDSDYLLQDGAAPLVPNSGYWIDTDTQFEWTMNGEIVTDPVEVDLQDGWNLVANPLWFSGPVEGIKVKYENNIYTWYDATSGGLISSAIMGWQSSTDNYVLANDLMAWQGYWVGALANDLTLVFDYHDFVTILPSQAITGDLDFPTSSSWQTEMTISSESEQPCLITFGSNFNATAGFDPLLDLPIPPAPPAGGTRVGILHPEWSLSLGSLFATDFIYPTDDSVFWDIEIKTDQPGDVSLSWTTTDWPDGADFQLYIPSQNRVVVISMLERNSIDLPVSGETLLVRVRTPDFLSGTSAMPDRSYSMSISPNPFNPQTTIFFNLEEPGDVDLKIYTVRGEWVDTITARALTAGRHKMIWHGRASNGRSLPSGSYFIRMLKNGLPVGAATKMSLIR